MHPLQTLLFVVAASVTVSAAAESACHATSGPLARPLIELYTSEGCDSCPPAERWLSTRFGAAGDSPSHAIALAFHVDYWDRLGWVDRFASGAYTARQYDRMRANGATFVYTPQLLLQGRDFAQWRGADAGAIDGIAHSAAAATITVDVTPHANEIVVRADARAVDAKAASDAKLVVAYADSGLVSEVKAGENRGRRLAHDHVVRALRVVDARADGHFRATIVLPIPRERGMHPQLVAFVEREARGEVLQALALPLDDCPPN